MTWELEQRKSLDESHKAMVVSQEAMEEEIGKKKDYLESLQPKLKTILDSTKPVQVSYAWVMERSHYVSWCKLNLST